MSAGAIPVFVSKSTVRPFAEELDWSAFSFVFSPDQAGSEMVKALRAVPREEIETMQVSVVRRVTLPRTNRTQILRDTLLNVKGGCFFPAVKGYTPLGTSTGGGGGRL